MSNREYPISRKFHLENVGKEEDVYASNGEATSGFGLFVLSNERVQYHFREEDMSLDEAESYIENCLNNLPDETVDELCKKMCTWKDHLLTDCYPDMKCPDGLPDAQGRDLLRFISVSDIYIYRNPYDKNDPLFGASVLAGMEWDFEDGIEIIIKGKEVLEVREFLGYGEYAIWDESDDG
ncbi:hypothetical protein [Paenibacillus sp. J2TS4]|uniref:DUF6985 domain-containing protein n=1 Tax=Paenibacillus sp. J2TS4 TaxID=2807194 RepID=UPI001B1242F8|nr:hypothetical protein [Paenibacillus sp. J2TS4]GIP33563.1 hypothetical protein J2TS4_27730 [Paenibacillus sp. J2TS4]